MPGMVVVPTKTDSRLELEDFADVAFDPLEGFGLAGIGKAVASGVDHGHGDGDVMTESRHSLELAVAGVDADKHRFSEGIASFALRPRVGDGQLVRAEGLFRGKWPHAFFTPVQDGSEFSQ